MTKNAEDRKHYKKANRIVEERRKRKKRKKKGKKKIKKIKKEKNKM